MVFATPNGKNPMLAFVGAMHNQECMQISRYCAGEARRGALCRAPAREFAGNLAPRADKAI
jgi:hypothetical protein